MSWNLKEVIVFVMLCLFMTTFFAMVNLPSALQSNTIHGFHINASQFATLVSMSSWASLLDVVHGYLLDRYLGIKLATLLYCVISTVGSIIYGIACFTKGYGLLMVGRSIYGFGSNPLILCSNKHVIQWFGAGKNINLVYSIIESILWLGSSVTYFLSVHLLTFIQTNWPNVDPLSVTMASETAFLTAIFVITASIMAIMFNLKTNEDGNKDPWSNEHNEKKKLVFKDYVVFPLIFWAFSLTIFLYFVSILSFISLSQEFYKKMFGLSATYASTLTGVLNCMAAILSPFIGIAMDRYGQNLTCLTVAIILNLLSHVLLAYNSVNPLIAVILLGFSIVFSAGIWSQFQFLVEEHQYMIAYGVAQTGLNGATAIGSIIGGVVIDNYGYAGFTNYLISMIGCAFLSLVIVWILNLKNNNILNKVPSERLQYLGRTVQTESSVTGIENSNYNSDNGSLENSRIPSSLQDSHID